MKKILAVCICFVMVFALVGCGGVADAKQSAIVGVWHAVDEETDSEYGLGIEFTKDGKLRYGLTEDVFSQLADGADVDDAMAGLDMLMSIEYKIVSDTDMQVTVSALFGLASESETVAYSLDGDTLTFDGAVYTRVK